MAMGVSSRLSAGMRAFAIRTDVTSGVSGFLRPGDRVDVYWTGQIRESQNLTKLIQAGIKIIAIDQSADEDSKRPQVARTVWSVPASSPSGRSMSEMA